MTHLLLATRNGHKTREFRQVLGPNFSIGDLSSHLEIGEIAETGSSFAENAQIKASAVSQKISGWVVADDSGLEVDSLGGEPGVRSARYAGERASDAANRAKLLQALDGLGVGASRDARFRCVLVLANAGELIATFEGVVEGIITTEEKGIGGFGYDSLFLPNDSNRTFAEVSATEKNSISHRGRAVVQLRTFLESHS